MEWSEPLLPRPARAKTGGVLFVRDRDTELGVLYDAVALGTGAKEAGEVRDILSLVVKRGDFLEACLHTCETGL